jgi:ribosomal protein S18 acetylase RimI-like enzyme
MSIEIKIANDGVSIRKCLEAMHALRPHLTINNIEPIILGMMRNGYNLIYIEENSKAAAACGYRYTEHLAWGKSIYIDDLTTHPECRKKGYAKHLLDFVFEQAKKNGCRQLHLDSGCNSSRYYAHRLYLKYGFNITSHHFAMDIK